MTRSITAEEKQKYLDNIKHALSSNTAVGLEDAIRNDIYEAVNECIDSVSSNEETTSKAKADIQGRLLKSVASLITESKSKKKNTQAWLTDTEDLIAVTITLAYLCAYSSVQPADLNLVNKLFLAFQKKITSPDAVDFSSFSEILNIFQSTPWVNEETFPIFIQNFNSIKGTITAQNLSDDEDTETIKTPDSAEEVQKTEETEIPTKEPIAEQLKQSKSELPTSVEQELDTVAPYNLQDFLKQHPNISFDALKAYLISNGIDPNNFRPDVKVSTSFNASNNKTYEDEVKVADEPVTSSTKPEQHNAEPQFINDSDNNFNSQSSSNIDNDSISSDDSLNNNESFTDMSNRTSSAASGFSEEGDASNDKVYDHKEDNEDEEDTAVADDILVTPDSETRNADVPPPPSSQSATTPRPIITDEDETRNNSNSTSNNKIYPEFMKNEDEPNTAQERIRSPMHFRLPNGFGKPTSVGIWNTPVITDFGYPFLNFSSEAMLHLFKTKDIDDKKRTFKKIKKMLKEAKKRYGGIWKAVYGAPLELFKKFANDPGTICVPNYLKVDAGDLNENSERVNVTPIKYFSVDPSYQATVDVPREYLENFYDVLDYTKAFKTYVKYSDGLTMQEFYEEVTENGGVSPFYLLIPKQARYSRTNVSTGSLFSALFGGTRCIMLKTIFKGRRGCFLIEANTAKNLFSDIN